MGCARHRFGKLISNHGGLQIRRLLFGVVYWLVWTVILPRLGRYRLEEKGDVLDDGTAITVLTRVPVDEVE